MEKDIEIIDTHCHLAISQLLPDIYGILERSRRSGVTDFIIPGYIHSGWNNILELCRQRSFLHAALGLHPCYLHLHDPKYLNRLRVLSRQEKLVAIGEIGLDFQEGQEFYREQLELFELQLAIATAATLPVLLHVRKAHDQVLATLRRKHFDCGGIVHAFNGSRQQADQYVKMGFKLGYGGTLTYNRAKRIRRLATELPLDCIVLETDAPDIPLVGRQGEVNSPEYLPEILDVLVSLRVESKEEIAMQTSINVRQIINL